MEHEKYNEILEAKNRCLRLKYHGDFHMDILPGIQEFAWDDDRLCIPDRSLGLWVSSNPITVILHVLKITAHGNHQNIKKLI